MIYTNLNLKKILFKDFDFMSYLSDSKIPQLLSINLDTYGDPRSKKISDPLYSVNPNINLAYEPEIDDLVRLHWLITTRRVTTILEFGIGKSTIIFNDAIEKNLKRDKQFVSKNLRRNNLYECHTIDNYKKWINEVKKKNNLKRVRYHKSNLKMGTFQGRACTYYNPLPNICPDFIYLDGPDQFSPVGKINGLTTNHKDRMPMAADILVFEHFLTPGTLIVTDGRTANARFLKNNFQRDWCYYHDSENDQHYFELLEEPLGVYNFRQIEFCLGHSYFTRLKKAKFI